MKVFLKVSYVETFFEDFIELNSFPLSVGRDPAAIISLMGHEISRNHAEIYEKDGFAYLKDSGSRTGIWHEGKQVQEIKITEGLQLRIGPALLNFSYEKFPLEQTISFGHAEEPVHHEPLFHRLEALLSPRLPFFLFALLMLLAYFTTPDFYRKSDFAKNLSLALLSKTLLAPFVIALLIVAFRKLNRGDYAWHRSLCLAYIVCIFGQLTELAEGAFCWFSTFDLVWNSIFVSILMTAMLFFWWLFAVGKNASIKERLTRALAVSVIAYGILAGIEYLATGYKSNFEIESCDSLTGWHWSKGEALSSVEDFLTESAKKLSK